MLILHIISNEDDRARIERVTRYMSETFVHQYVTPNELAAFQGDIDVVHAHRWFGCGRTAYLHASAKKIPYVVDVVQSDLHDYHKLLIFSKKNAEQLLTEAARVVFTAPSQEDFLANHLSSKNADTVFSKSTLLYEPLDSFWLGNLHIHPPTALVHIKLLYVGAMDSNCHLDVVQNAMKKLQRRNYDITLTTVGDLAEEELLDVYRKHDIFLQLDEKTPSTRRFAEALSQGLPVIYARDGIADGIFKDLQAGYAVNPKSSDELASAILNVSDFFGTIEQQIMRIHPMEMFDGRDQARHYEHLYANAKMQTLSS